MRANDFVGIMAALDYQVTVFPMQPAEADPAAIAADFPDTVEILHDRSHKEFPAFLESRPGYYDAIWVSRTPNLDLIRPVLEDAALVPGRTRIILDTEAVIANREALRAQVLGEPEKQPLQDALRREFLNAWCFQDVLAVSEQELRLLTGIGLPSVRLLGTMRDLAPTPRPWRERSGLLFSWQPARRRDAQSRRAMLVRRSNPPANRGGAGLRNSADGGRPSFALGDAGADCREFLGWRWRDWCPTLLRSMTVTGWWWRRPGSRQAHRTKYMRFATGRLARREKKADSLEFSIEKALSGCYRSPISRPNEALRPQLLGLSQ